MFINFLPKWCPAAKISIAYLQQCGDTSLLLLLLLIILKDHSGRFTFVCFLLLFRLCHNKQTKVYLPEPPFPHAEVSPAAVSPTREEQRCILEIVDNWKYRFLSHMQLSDISTT